jgi:hypothetical protein
VLGTRDSLAAGQQFRQLGQSLLGLAILTSSVSDAAAVHGNDLVWQLSEAVVPVLLSSISP